MDAHSLPSFCALSPLLTTIVLSDRSIWSLT